MPCTLHCSTIHACAIGASNTANHCAAAVSVYYAYCEHTQLALLQCATQTVRATCYCTRTAYDALAYVSRARAVAVVMQLASTVNSAWELPLIVIACSRKCGCLQYIHKTEASPA